MEIAYLPDKINEFEFRCPNSSDLIEQFCSLLWTHGVLSIYMERLQNVISLRAADTSRESSYCFGAVSLVKKIRAVGSLKELNLAKACGAVPLVILS